MVSDLKTFAHKGCKIAAKKREFFGEFCLTSWIFLVSVLIFPLYEKFFVSRMRDFIPRKVIRNNISSNLYAIQYFYCFVIKLNSWWVFVKCIKLGFVLRYNHFLFFCPLIDLLNIRLNPFLHKWLKQIVPSTSTVWGQNCFEITLLVQ